jgi:chromate reductase
MNVEQKKIGVLVGSLRKGSFTRKTAKALMALSPESLSCEFLEIGELPIYNQDLEEAPPAPWTDFRAKVKSCDGFLFVTPEYNRSIPAVLKNAIDVASRPFGKNAWDAKPGAVVSVSPGALGAFGANHHLRQALVFLNIYTMAQPEAYIGGAAKLFDEQDNVTVDATKDFLKKFMTAFADWVAKHPARS